MKRVWIIIFVSLFVAGAGVLAALLLIKDTPVIVQNNEIKTEMAKTDNTSDENAKDEEKPVIEGGIAPTLMALDMKKWEWVSAKFSDGRVLEPAKPGAFTMTFGAGGGVDIGTDCNSMSSSYEAYSGSLTLGPISSTKMYCEGSQETEFTKLLEAFATYQFTGKGELIVKTNDDTKLIFR